MTEYGYNGLYGQVKTKLPTYTPTFTSQGIKMPTLPSYNTPLEAPSLTKAPSIPTSVPKPTATGQRLTNLSSANDASVFSLASPGAQKAAGFIGGIADNFNTKEAANSNDAIAQQARKMGRDMLSKAGPWGMAASAALSVIDAAGGNSEASKGLGAGNDALNMVASQIPGLGWVAGKTDGYTMSDTLSDSSGFGGLKKSGQEAEAMSGKKFLFGRKKANDKIAEQTELNNKADDMLDFGQQLNQAVGTISNELDQTKKFRRAGGYDLTASLKNGAKLDLKKAKEVARNTRKRETRTEEVAMFEQGGKINMRKGSYNIIPGGAFHSRKHNIAEHNEELAKQITHKGIPVITKGAMGEVDQIAEIEVGELTLRLNATKKLEELTKDGSDEAAIKAGKYLVNELLNKTIDNSGRYEG